jgi:hydroxypyruvate reductase/glycerate 2-kinase
MIIKNRPALATSELKNKALAILEAGVEAVLPARVMDSLSFDKPSRMLQVCGDAYPTAGGRIFVIGGGKASGLMAARLEDIIGAENITAGVVNCKSDIFRTQKIRLIKAGHPIPDENGSSGVRQMLALKERFSIKAGDIVICLISGGGSALLPYPAAGISLEDKRRITALLITSGAEISSINVVRKHLSAIKGGKLAAFFAPATVISLVLSDVIGNDLSTIASGPTFPDCSTFEEAYQILKSYNLLDRLPEAALQLLAEGRQGQLPDNPSTLPNAHNYIIGDNTLALKAMQKQAETLGLRPHIITAAQKGDTEKAARTRAAEIKKDNSGYNVFLIGGETTPSLPENPGKGGRNQHYTAVSLLAMQDYRKGWAVASLGTDGSDYLPDVAGAIVDNQDAARVQKQGLDAASYIAAFDSYNLLVRLDDAVIVTGDTGTNVGDIIVYVLE